MTQNKTESKMSSNTMESAPEKFWAIANNLAKEKSRWGAKNIFCLLGRGTKSLKKKERIRSMATNNSKTQ